MPGAGREKGNTMLKKFVCGWALAALILSVAPSVRAGETMMMAPKGAAKSTLPALGKPAAKCSLMPDMCSHCKAPMKAVNGTTMKCTKCGMAVPAMCGKCKAKMVAGKCSKCGMTMAALKGNTKPAPAAKCCLMPDKCSHCKVAMKAVNGTTMKCPKCNMSAPAMCGKCKANLKAGKCPKCGMSMKDLQGDKAGGKMDKMAPKKM